MVFLLCLRSASTDRLQWLQPCSRVAGKCYVGSYLVHMHMLPAEVSVYEAEVSVYEAEVSVYEAEVSVYEAEVSVYEAEVSMYEAEVSMYEAEVSVYEAEVGARQYALPCMCPVGSLEFQSSSVHRC